MPLVTPDEIAAVLDWAVGSDLTELEQPAEAADFIIARMLDEAKGPHDEHANDREAALAVAIQIFTARQAPGGQMAGLEYQPVMTTHLLGPGLVSRVQGLISPCRAYGGLIVG